MKTVSAILLLLMAGLLAILAYEIRSGIVATPQITEVHSGQPSPTVSEVVPSFSLPAVDNYAETVERPLFAFDRRPAQAVPVSEQPEVQQPARQQAEPSRFVLSAVVMEGDLRVALLRDATSGKLTRLKEGSSVGGWSLSEVRADSVVLSNGSTTQEVQLRRFEPPPPPKRKRRKSRVAARVDEDADSEERSQLRRSQRQTQQSRTEDHTTRAE